MKKVLSVWIFASCLTALLIGGNSYAKVDCRDIEFVYARGSGGERYNTDE